MAAGVREWDPRPQGMIRAFVVGEVLDSEALEELGLYEGALVFEASVGAGELGRISWMRTGSAWSPATSATPSSWSPPPPAAKRRWISQPRREPPPSTRTPEPLSCSMHSAEP